MPGPGIRGWRSLRTIAALAADPRTLLPDRGRPATTTPHLGVAGFYGWGNFGDELFWRAFGERLGPTIGIENLLGPAWRAGSAPLRRGVLRSDAILVGAGDLVVPWERNRYWQPSLLRRPVFVAGVGVPTWRKPVPAAVAHLRAFFQHPSVRSIGVRDEASAAWIRAELAPAVPVEIAPDLACAASLPPVAPEADPPIFGVAVRARAVRDDLRHVEALCKRAVGLGYRLRRIVLATGTTRMADLQATAQLGFEDTELVSTDDLDAISRAIGGCSVFATMKFHGVVVATLYGVPTIALMPTAKTRHFLAATGLSDQLSRFDAEELPDRARLDVPRLDPAIPATLRSGALAALDQLRDRILQAAAEGVPPAR